MGRVGAVRLSRADRRDQLLDVAAELVLERGPVAVTIERVAGEAGVSRALTYQHFGNSEEVLRAVYRREVTRLAEEILHAIEGPTGSEARLRAAVRTYLDVVRSRGALFTVLAATGSPIASRADDGTRAGPRFVAELFEEIFDLPGRRARVVASLYLGALNGGIEAWAAGEMRRSEVEDVAVSIALHLVNEAPRA